MTLPLPLKLALGLNSRLPALIQAEPLRMALMPVMLRRSPSASLSLARRLARLIERLVSSAVVAKSAPASGVVLTAREGSHAGVQEC